MYRICDCPHSTLLMASRLKVETDHWNLVYLSTMADDNQRLLRWKIQLSEYQLEIVHIAGRDKVVADALARVFPDDAAAEVCGWRRDFGWYRSSGGRGYTGSCGAILR